MTDGLDNFWDSLSADEACSAEFIMEQLKDVSWAQSLLHDIRSNGGITQANKDRLFELRFGYALHAEGIVPRHEIPGEGDSTIDFGFTWNGRSWAVELMRLGETEAVKAATDTSVDERGKHWTKRVLSTSAEDPRQSLEGETLKAVQRICQKCEADGHPHKFPVPQDALHVILVDFRTFSNGGDEHDRLHIGLAGDHVAERYRLYWNQQVITGVFDERTRVKGAAEARDRVHFLGFTNERTYKLGELPYVTQFIANPHLFPDAAAVRAAIATWPLQPATVLNDAD
jgi:hypothetical protein